MPRNLDLLRRILSGFHFLGGGDRVLHGKVWKRKAARCRILRGQRWVG
jgi:hypothetical protein